VVWEEEWVAWECNPISLEPKNSKTPDKIGGFFLVFKCNYTCIRASNYEQQYSKYNNYSSR